ncbi:ABC transporter permease, partial [Pseudomonas sp. BGM005]|nr:ABC transporter permease [Pseudomonas sp. BG5]
MSRFRRLLGTWEGMAGFAILVILLLFGLLAPIISPGDPLRIAGRALLAPFSDPAFPLGTDRLG